MIRRHVLAVLALVAVGAMVASPAEAGGGGGGTKGRNGTVRVLGGQTGGGVGLIPLAGTTAVPPAGGYPSVAALQAAGGAVINPGQVLQFKVAGPGNAFVGPIDPAGAFPVLTGAAAYSGAQNQTGYLKVGGTNVAPTIAGTGDKF
ncbi:MAG: hypothetical protein ACKOB1_01645 [Planctomycetia bacterium]